MTETSSTPRKLVVGSSDIGKFLGISKTRVNQLLDEGRLPKPIQQQGKGRLWLTEDIVTWATERGRTMHFEALNM